MFNTKISLYGISILVAITCGVYVTYKNSKTINLKKEELIGLLIYIVVGCIFGAKYFTLLTNPSKYIGVEFYKVGLSSYGAVIGIILMLLLFSKQYKKKFGELIYIFLPSIPLMYSIGKIGCFLVGCCYGIEYNGPFSIIYNYSYSAPKGISLFPIQLLEAIVFMLIFIYIYRNKENKYNVKFIGKTLVICGASKFLLDYLRESHVGQIISINQIVSLIFIILGLYFIFENKH